MSRHVYLNGALLPESEATISIYDGGWLHGAALFETMRAENWTVFRLQDHLRRLHRSAETLLRIVHPEVLPTPAKLRDLLVKNHHADARIRLTVSAGAMLPGAGPSDGGPGLTVLATTAGLDAYPAKLYEQGMHIAVCNFRQSRTDPLASHKTTAMLDRLLALRAAHGVKCAEALWFTTDNYLSEGCISNVFVVKDGTLKTPPLDTPVMPGIARRVVLEVAQRDGLSCREEALTIDDVLDADELLLTNAIMQVMPVIRVESRDIADGRVGPVAKALLKGYRTLVDKECRTDDV